MDLLFCISDIRVFCSDVGRRINAYSSLMVLLFVGLQLLESGLQSGLLKLHCPGRKAAQKVPDGSILLKKTKHIYILRF